MLRSCALGLAVAAVLAAAARAQTSDHYALLMVWMPGLCKLEPERTECKDLTLRRYDGRNLAFMALEVAHDSGVAQTFCFTMPSDSEMDRDRRWCDMDQPHVRPDLTSQLQELMPVSRSCQDRGLWARYASCTLYSPDDYYSRGIKLAKAVAATQMNTKLVGAVGGVVSQQALVDAFQADFGDESGNAIDFICRRVSGRSHLFEVKITMTARALSRGLDRDYLWKPGRGLRRSCPGTIVIDAPPGAETAPVAATAPTAPAVPVKPAEPAAPESVPVPPVEVAPLEPPDRPERIRLR
jgi:ribonuclease I